MNEIFSRVVIAFGSNLPFGENSSRDIVSRALVRLKNHEIRILEQSRWYRSAPVPRSNQPDFINGAVLAESPCGPAQLLAILHDVEDDFGRIRRTRNEARTLDLDLIDFAGLVNEDGGRGPILPHPRMRDRAFVLLPLRDVVPDWRHPVTGESVDEMIAALPEPMHVEPL